jgi:chromosome segregation ATPase
MADLAELEKRVEALEAAQNDTTQSLRWAVSKLARIAAVQDEHTLHLERLSTTQDNQTARLERIEGEISSLRRDLPGMVIDAVREGMKPQ